jgi:hypothetical protein
MAVLRCSALVANMTNIFTSVEYADTHFVYGFCNGSGRAAVVPIGRNIHITKHLRMYRGLWVRLVPSYERKHVNTTDWRISVLAAVGRSSSTRLSRNCRGTDVVQRHVWRILHQDWFYSCHLQRVKQLFTAIMPTVGDIINCCTHGYTFRMISCSRMRVNLPGTVIQSQGISTLDYKGINMK